MHNRRRNVIQVVLLLGTCIVALVKKLIRISGQHVNQMKQFFINSDVEIQYNMQKNNYLVKYAISDIYKYKLMHNK